MQRFIYCLIIAIILNNFNVIESKKAKHKNHHKEAQVETRGKAHARQNPPANQNPPDQQDDSNDQQPSQQGQAPDAASSQQQPQPPAQAAQQPPAPQQQDQDLNQPQPDQQQPPQDNPEDSQDDSQDQQQQQQQQPDASETDQNQFLKTVCDVCVSKLSELLKTMLNNKNNQMVNCQQPTPCVDAAPACPTPVDPIYQSGFNSICTQCADMLPCPINCKRHCSDVCPDLCCDRKKTSKSETKSKNMKPKKKHKLKSQ